jgi:hypothetical protein
MNKLIFVETKKNQNHETIDQVLKREAYWREHGSGGRANTCEDLKWKIY